MKESKLRELIKNILQKEISSSGAGTINMKRSGVGKAHQSFSGVGDSTRSGGVFSHYGKKKKKDDEDEELEEITVTGNIDGYSTPNAFSGNEKINKSKFKKSAKTYGYELVKEELDKKDIEEIKKLIRDVIGDVYRDIWLKRNSWK
ncbi:MAG: hypothetical protein H8D94_01640 [Candidatus Pelagibacter sp.]|nr:hypothetical protein [Candidatus Pelagibacter sp.]